MGICSEDKMLTENRVVGLTSDRRRNLVLRLATQRSPAAEVGSVRGPVQSELLWATKDWRVAMEAGCQ